MKISSILFVVIGIVLLIPLAAAHEADTPKTTPDKPFYGLSVAVDKVGLALTFDKHAKAHKGLTIAHERLLEIKAMREANKLDAAQKSADNYADTMNTVSDAIETAPEDAPEKDAEEIGKIDSELADVTETSDDVSNELASTAEVNSLTESQKARIAKINEKISGHKKAIARLEERKAKLGSKLFGEKLTAIEQDHANTAGREAKAQNEITAAEAAIATATPLAANLPHGSEFLANANKHLQDARDAFTAKRYGEAFGQANAAGHLANAIVKRAGQLEKREEKKAEHAEKKAEIENRTAEKKVEKENKASSTSGYAKINKSETAHKDMVIQNSGGY